MSDSFKAVLRVTGTVVLTMALCLALVIGLAACGGDKDATEVDPALVGKWHTVGLEEGGTLEFTADGRMIATSDNPAEGSMEFTCVAVEGSIVLSQAGEEMPAVTFSIEGDVLTIVDPESETPETYERVSE